MAELKLQCSACAGKITVIYEPVTGRDWDRIMATTSVSDKPSMNIYREAEEAETAAALNASFKCPHCQATNSPRIGRVFKVDAQV